MKWVSIPSWLKRIFPLLVWEIPASEKDVYLTFDDGPTPGITSRVLALLSEHHVKATFFCLGSNIERYPALFKEIKDAGHTIGNHGYHHLSGFSVSNKRYYKNVKLGAEVSGSKLFRPPYGRIMPRQVNKIKKEYRIIMWSIMSMDFDRKLSAGECLNNVISNLTPGSIIVMHDTEKAGVNLLVFLPALLTWLEEQGYRASALYTVIP